MFKECKVVKIIHGNQSDITVSGQIHRLTAILTTTRAALVNA